MSPAQFEAAKAGIEKDVVRNRQPLPARDAPEPDYRNSKCKLVLRQPYHCYDETSAALIGSRTSSGSHRKTSACSCIGRSRTAGEMGIERLNR